MNRLAVSLAPFLLLAACASDHGLHRTTQLLNERLHNRLAPDIAAGKASLQPLSNGAQVTLLGPSTFANTVDAKTEKYREVRASVIEGLLDPSLVRIAVADTSTLPVAQREARVRNVNDYFRDNGLGLSLLPEASVAPAAPAPEGVAITVLLACPAHRQPTNWNYDPPIPSCH